jgi:hypothetical protein
MTNAEENLKKIKNIQRTLKESLLSSRDPFQGSVPAFHDPS